MSRNEFKKIIYTVCALILAGISAYDGIYRMESFRVIGGLLETAVARGDTGLLVLASFELVALDTLWLVPGILSGFLLIDVWRSRFPFRWWVNYFLVLPWVGVIHLVLAMQGSGYSFIGGFIVVILAILAVIEMGEARESFAAVALVVFGIGMAVDWLNIVPAFSFIPISHGDLDVGIKLAAGFLQGESVLNLGLFFSVFFVFISLVITLLISVYLRRISLVEENKVNEMKLQEMEIQARQARVLQEMHTLVHDLKTPLMTIRGLNSLVEMSAANEKVVEYCRRIDGSVDKVNAMVSEILYDEVRKKIAVEELITYVRAHVLVKKAGQEVVFDIAKELPLLEINVIRMSRVLINIIENAFTATAGVRDARITIRVYAKNGDTVFFEVTDNGRGIPAEQLEKVWNWGYSTRGDSAGLGLAFVRQIVENHHGIVEISSSESAGTTVKISLKGAKDDESTDN